MATRAYRDWVAAGRPYRLATPLAELLRLAAAAGVAVDDELGTEEQLRADPPLDRTPYSAAARPAPLAEYVVTAVRLADGPHTDRILAAARAGHLPWLRYLTARGHNHSDRHGFAPRPHRCDELEIAVRTDHLDTPLDGYDPFTDAAGGGDRVDDDAATAPASRPRRRPAKAARKDPA